MADRRHGIHARYVADRCRCTPCKAANTAYENNRSRLIAYGRWQPYVDAEPIREHVRSLMAFGLGWQRLARISGVPQGSVSKLLYGGPSDRPPSRRVRAATAERLLSVVPSLDLLGATVKVDASGTRRRLQALVAIGWSQWKLARRLGVERSNFGSTMASERVYAEAAREVIALYDELWNQPPPEDSHRDKVAASRARNRARTLGWLPPLAWDDDLIDVPDEQMPAELERRVALMTDDELRQCHTARHNYGDMSPLTVAAAREHRRRRSSAQEVA